MNQSHFLSPAPQGSITARPFAGASDITMQMAHMHLGSHGLPLPQNQLI